MCLVAKPLPCQWEAGVFLGEELEGRSPSFRFFSLSEGRIFFGGGGRGWGLGGLHLRGQLE